MAFGKKNQVKLETIYGVAVISKGRKTDKIKVSRIVDSKGNGHNDLVFEPENYPECILSDNFTSGKYSVTISGDKNKLWNVLPYDGKAGAVFTGWYRKAEGHPIDTSNDAYGNTVVSALFELTDSAFTGQNCRVSFLPVNKLEGYEGEMVCMDTKFNELLYAIQGEESPEWSLGDDASSGEKLDAAIDALEVMEKKALKLQKSVIITFVPAKNNPNKSYPKYVNVDFSELIDEDWEEDDVEDVTPEDEKTVDTVSDDEDLEDEFDFGADEE